MNYILFRSQQCVNDKAVTAYCVGYLHIDWQLISIAWNELVPKVCRSRETVHGEVIELMPRHVGRQCHCDILVGKRRQTIGAETNGMADPA